MNTDHQISQKCPLCNGWYGLGVTHGKGHCVATMNIPDLIARLRRWHEIDMEPAKQVWLEAANALESLEQFREWAEPQLHDRTELLDKIETLERENAALRKLLLKADPLEHCATSCDYCTSVSDEIRAWRETQT